MGEYGGTSVIPVCPILKVLVSGLITKKILCHAISRSAGESVQRTNYALGQCNLGWIRETVVLLPVVEVLLKLFDKFDLLGDTLP